MKQIHGKPVSNRMLRDALVERVGVRETASAAELAEDLGITDTKEKHAVSVMMVDMTKQGVFIRESRGRYRVHPSLATRRGRSDEATIAAIITQHGGLATAPEILSHLGALPSQNQEVGYGGRGNALERQIRRELKASPTFRNFSIRGNTSFWTLKDDLLLQIPLSGRAIELFAKHQFQNATETHGGHPQSIEDLNEDIETHFVRVGRALRRVRRLFRHGLDDMARLADIDEVIEWARWRSPDLSREVRVEMRGRAKERADEEGVEVGSPSYEAILDQEELRFGAFALDMLESGSGAAHRAMPVAIYYIYGERFDLCPASLSRGLVHSRALDDRHKLLKSKWGWLP